MGRGGRNNTGSAMPMTKTNSNHKAYDGLQRYGSQKTYWVRYYSSWTYTCTTKKTDIAIADGRLGTPQSDSRLPINRTELFVLPQKPHIQCSDSRASYCLRAREIKHSRWAPITLQVVASRHDHSVSSKVHGVITVVAQPRKRSRAL